LKAVKLTKPLGITNNPAPREKDGSDNMILSLVLFQRLFDPMDAIRSAHSEFEDPSQVQSKLCCDFTSQVDVPYTFELIRDFTFVVDCLSIRLEPAFIDIAKLFHPSIGDTLSLAFVEGPDIIAVAFLQQYQ
jgi:hypothetical protein